MVTEPRTHIEIDSLTAEHYPSGLGVSTPSPRLSWRFKTGPAGWTQTGYNVKIQRNGKVEEYAVESPESVLVPWPSAPLRSREIVRVEVSAHGADNVVSPVASLDIEAAFLDTADWSAQLVGAPAQDADKPKRPFRVRASFEAPEKITRARLYITAHGVYESYVNGERVGDEFMAPGWRDYRFTLPYAVHDVTAALQPGKRNVLGAWIGEGWYSTRLGWAEGLRNVYGNQPSLLAQLEIDGKIVASTGDGWEWSYGSITRSELYDGEDYDTTIEDSWDAGEWKVAEVLGKPEEQLVTVESPPVRAVERFSAVEIITTPSGKTVVDFGQNIAGYVEIASEPPSSGTLTLRHAEVMENGELGVRPLRCAAATDKFTLGGRSLKGHHIKFAFHGFRYVEVDGWANLNKEDLVAVLTSTDMERTGTFECSHAMLNRLHSNVVYSTRGNTISVPTDCPQRDERLGWTGDIQVFTPTLSYLYQTPGFLKGWLQDVACDQKANNGIPPLVIPHINTTPLLEMPQAVWGDVAVLTPWDVYNASGDVSVLIDQWESITTWLDKGVKRDEETRLWDRDMFQLADWLEADAPPENPAGGKTDNWLVADAYLVHTTRVAARIAHVLGKKDKAAQYDTEAKELFALFYDTYVTPRGRVVSDTQTSMALILHFDLISEANEAHREILAKRLEKLVIDATWQVSTGFAGTPIILHTLARHDMLHHAYRMLLARECPSWLSPILLGATTIWERWDSMLADGSINPGEMTSFNHYALGSVANFLHSVVGGLSPAAPGWKEISVKPRPGGNLTHATSAITTPYGYTECKWEIVGDKLEVRVVVPPNTTARVELPGVDEKVGAGTHEYSIQWKSDPRFPPPLQQHKFAMPVDKDWVR